MTAALDRLERAGYVRRVRDQGDRRRVLVEVTDRVARATGQLYGPLATAGDELLARYTDDQLRAMVDIMRESARLQLEQAERIRGRTRR